MNILVVGGGGREHTLCWKIAQSPLVEKVYCAPGNAGIANVAECVPLGVDQFEELAAFATKHACELVVIGPEAPLTEGLADHLAAAGFQVFGPEKAAARIEGSKTFAKEIMAKYGIPTADFAEFTDADAAIAYASDRGFPIVIKADGLAAGKGVTVAKDYETAQQAIDAAMKDRVFGDAGAKVLIEDCLVGEEASILAFTDGATVLPMATSQDHKPAYDNDEGPNTGGMGAYSPAPVVNDALFEEIKRTVLQPCIDGLAQEGICYRGVLYAGLMITEDGPKVIEFNCRFGDPEVEAVLPRMKTDIVPVMRACCEGRLDEVSLEWDPQPCVTVVMASGGYPGPYEKGKVIEGIDSAEADGAVVFHAGTRSDDGKAVLTNGGRVLDVTALGATIPEAIRNAYSAVERIHFEGAHYRTDIGQKAARHID